MEQITKLVQKIGNGGHIYLPKETIGKKVVITIKEKTREDIEEEIIHILKPYLKNIKGIYLHGSYARNEQTKESDIDIVVITDEIITLPKKTNEYEIIALTEKQLKKSLNYTAPLILPSIKDAIPILNQETIQPYKKVSLTKNNTKWYLETTKSSLALAKQLLDENDVEGTMYPLMTRLRGLLMIQQLLNKKQYYNKLVTNYLSQQGMKEEKIKEIIRVYKEVRDDNAISNNTLSMEDGKKLWTITNACYKTVWEKLK